MSCCWRIEWDFFTVSGNRYRTMGTLRAFLSMWEGSSRFFFELFFITPRFLSLTSSSSTVFLTTFVYNFYDLHFLPLVALTTWSNREKKNMTIQTNSQQATRMQRIVSERLRVHLKLLAFVADISVPRQIGHSSKHVFEIKRSIFKLKRGLFTLNRRLSK